MKVLTHGQNVAVNGSEIVESLVQLFDGFTQADHKPRFRQELRRDFFYGAENIERTTVLALGTELWGQPLDHFEVVVVKLWGGVAKRLDAIEPGMEVCGKYFHRGSRAGFVDRTNAACEVAGTFVVEIVAGDSRDDHMSKGQSGDGVGETIGLVNGRGVGPSGFDGTVVASSGAFVAEDHERGVPLGPAFGEVRAFGILADGGDTAFGDDFHGAGKVA